MGTLGFDLYIIIYSFKKHGLESFQTLHSLSLTSSDTLLHSLKFYQIYSCNF